MYAKCESCNTKCEMSTITLDMTNKTANQLSPIIKKDAPYNRLISATSLFLKLVLVVLMIFYPTKESCQLKDGYFV